MLKQNNTRNFIAIQDKNIVFDTPATEVTTFNGRKALIIHAKSTSHTKVCHETVILKTIWLIDIGSTQTS